MIAPLGHGSYGCVYRAEELETREPVAIKILTPRRANDPRTIEWFYREAVVAAQCRHPNVVAINDFGRSWEGWFFIAMELVNGRSLSELIREEYPAQPSRIVAMMSQLLRGLECIHTAGIVHADIKSDNVMVQVVDGRDRVVIVDFGLARRILLPDPGSPQGILASHQSSVYGTPGYMAPEIIRGSQPTYACDVYSAGIVLFQMLFGRTPFKGKIQSEILRRQLEEPNAILTDIVANQTIPEALGAVLLRATAVDPEHRFPDVSEFRRVLEQSSVGLSWPGSGTSACSERSS